MFEEYITPRTWAIGSYHSNFDYSIEALDLSRDVSSRNIKGASTTSVLSLRSAFVQHGEDEPSLPNSAMLQSVSTRALSRLCSSLLTECTPTPIFSTDRRAEARTASGPIIDRQICIIVVTAQPKGTTTVGTLILKNGSVRSAVRAQARLQRWNSAG